MIALWVALVQLFALILMTRSDLQGPFWDAIDTLMSHSDMMGYGILLLFALAFVVAWIWYQMGGYRDQDLARKTQTLEQSPRQSFDIPLT